MNTKDCFKKGLLKKTEKQPDLAKKDLRQATFFLKEAEELLHMKKKVMAALGLYNAFFHTTRALLFIDGIKERSHYCIARYVEETYIKEKKLETRYLDAFETMMSVRHNAQYSTEEVTIDENLEQLHNICEEFTQKVEELL